MPKILAFAGSAREGSFNVRLVRAGMEAVRSAGGDVTLVDFREFPMPLYDGDLEAAQGLPPHAKRFKELMKQHHGLLIASPEYNSSISPLLKNAIDWASRAEPGDQGMVAFSGKVAALISASPSALGGVRGLAALRSILGNIGVIVLPEQLIVPQADKAFGDDGSLKEDRHRTSLGRIASRLVQVTTRVEA